MPVAMQQVGNVAIKPELQFGQNEYFSKDDFSAFSSKMPLVGDGFAFFCGCVSTLSVDTCVSDAQDISAGVSRLSTVSSDVDISSCTLLPLVLDSVDAELPGRFHPPLALSLLDSNAAVGFQTHFLLSCVDMLGITVATCVCCYW